MASSSREFLGVVDHDDGHAEMVLTSANTGGGESLFGGAGLAVAVLLAEQRSERPPIWMTTQFISLTRRGETMRFRCDATAEGRTMTQLRVDAEVDGRGVMSGLGACGERPEHHRTGHVGPPSAPGPDES